MKVRHFASLKMTLLVFNAAPEGAINLAWLKSQPRPGSRHLRHVVERLNVSLSLSFFLPSSCSDDGEEATTWVRAVANAEQLPAPGAAATGFGLDTHLIRVTSGHKHNRNMIII